MKANRHSAALSFAIGLSIHLARQPSVAAALSSGVYQTLPGATVEELDIAGERRMLPISATITFDLNATPPSLTAFLPNAVLEGRDPFPLTVRSSFGAQLPDGTYYFRGDYLEGTQYLFDWRFSASTNGDVLWNGITGWAGGHIWQITISNIALVPQPQLSISRAASGMAQITWPSNFTNYTLESAGNLPATAWTAVTNPVVSTGDRLSVTVSPSEAQRFYRLRKPDI